MKKLSFLSLFLLIGILSYAQAPQKNSKKFLVIKKLGLSLGVNAESIHNLDYGFMKTALEDWRSFPYDLDESVEENLTPTGRRNNARQARLELSLNIPRIRNLEIRTALVGIFKRVDALYYQDRRDYYFKDFNMELHGREFALEASVIKSKHIKNRVFLYAGIGTNVGYSVNDRLLVEHPWLSEAHRQNLPDLRNPNPNDLEIRNFFTSIYNARNAFSNRIFAQLGSSVVLFNRFEIGVDVRMGLGHRTFHEGNLDFGDPRMTFPFSASVGTKWLLD